MEILANCEEEEVIELECNDFYHLKCVKTYISNQIEEQRFPIDCANKQCNFSIMLSQVSELLTEDKT